MRAFFGAGRIGRKLLIFGNVCGLKPDYFIDNNPELWGKTIEDIPIISIMELKGLSDDLEVLITCKDNGGIVRQLTDAGVNKEQIKNCDSILDMLDYILDDPDLKIPIKVSQREASDNITRIIFDLENGFVLGGVESWSIQTAEILEAFGYQIAYITNDALIEGCKRIRKKEISISQQESIWNAMESLLPLLVTEKHNCFVCNFIGYNFMMACLAKKIFP